MKFTLKQEYKLSVLHSQHCACMLWRLLSQDIRRHGIAPQSRSVPSPTSDELINQNKNNLDMPCAFILNFTEVFMLSHINPLALCFSILSWLIWRHGGTNTCNYFTTNLNFWYLSFTGIKCAFALDSELETCLDIRLCRPQYAWESIHVYHIIFHSVRMDIQNWVSWDGNVTILVVFNMKASLIDSDNDLIFGGIVSK